MTTRYIKINKADFDEFANINHFVRIEYNRAREIVYARVSSSHLARILIFSSIHISTSQGRDSGKDAIRVIVQIRDENEFGEAMWRVVHKSRRVHRVKNWKANLMIRLVAAMDQVHCFPCPNCGSAMILRDGKYGPFYSCANWSTTQCRGRV